jgi:hypothetical protein
MALGPTQPPFHHSPSSSAEVKEYEEPSWHGSQLKNFSSKSVLYVVNTPEVYPCM